MRTSIYHLTVEFGDCDPAGIVFSPNFYRWFNASSYHLIDASLGWNRLRSDFGVVGMPLLESWARFKNSATVGERLAIESSVVECARKVLRITHLVSRNGDLLVEGFEVRAFVVPRPDDLQRQRALEINDVMRSALA